MREGFLLVFVIFLSLRDFGVDAFRGRHKLDRHVEVESDQEYNYYYHEDNKYSSYEGGLGDDVEYELDDEYQLDDAEYQNDDGEYEEGYEGEYYGGDYYGGYYGSGYYDDLTVDDYPFLDDDFLAEKESNDVYYFDPDAEGGGGGGENAYQGGSYYGGYGSNDDDDANHSNKISMKSGDDGVAKSGRHQSSTARPIPLWSYVVVIYVSVTMSCCAAYMMWSKKSNASRDSYKFKALSTNEEVELVPIDDDDADV